MIWTPVHALVDRHFAGAGSPRADRRLFGHLRTCAPCRARYRARALLEELAGRAPGAQARLERGIFGPRRDLRRPLLLGCLAGAVALALVVPRLERDPFQARGGAVAAGPALTLYRLAAAGAPERTGAVLKAGEALAFSYLNPSGHTHLMVLAVVQEGLGQGRVFWFWPDPAANPTAVPIRPGGGELAEAVRQPLAPGRVKLVGLFLDRPVAVREVEAALAGGEAGLVALGGERWIEEVEVLP